MISKQSLVDVLVKETKCSKAAAGRAVIAMIDTITGAVKAGEDVQISGLGTFKAVDTPERTCRNPQDGSTIVVPAHKSVKYRAAKGFKELVNQL